VIDVLGVVVSTATVGFSNELAVDGLGDAGQPAVGVVTVAHRTPVCTCGWAGRPRAAQFLARHDAWMHAATYGCVPGVPFVAAR
jgi:hypothetical protein